MYIYYTYFKEPASRNLEEPQGTIIFTNHDKKGNDKKGNDKKGATVIWLSRSSDHPGSGRQA